ncbi:hypothetical protein [Dolichospermum planctonicum]|nr:hypothetical protein [Dolichospermum planctonicum]
MQKSSPGKFFTDRVHYNNNMPGLTQLVYYYSAYRSQLESRFATLTGSRNGDKFTGHDGVVMHSDTNAADNILARMSDVEITRYMKHSDLKKILLERSQKFWDSLMETEAITGKDKPQTLEPESNFTSQVNQRANYQQLTLFDLG